MDVWVQEFRQNLAEIDKAAKANAQAVNLSALNVTVSNGHQCEQAWELSIDNGPPTKHAGKTAAIAGLTPGQHTARVIGIIKGKTLQAEAAFSATGGRAEPVALTLA